MSGNDRSGVPDVRTLSDDARELVAIIESTQRLYPAFLAIVGEQSRQLAAGTYDSARAADAWLPLVEQAAREFERRTGATATGATLTEAAEHLAASEAVNIANGEYAPFA